MSDERKNSRKTSHRNALKIKVETKILKILTMLVENNSGFNLVQYGTLLSNSPQIGFRVENAENETHFVQLRNVEDRENRGENRGENQGEDRENRGENRETDTTEDRSKSFLDGLPLILLRFLPLFIPLLVICFLVGYWFS